MPRNASPNPPPGRSAGADPADRPEGVTAAEVALSEGLDHHDKGEFDRALECYKKAIELSPGLVVAHNNLGMVYIDKEMYREAIAELEETLRLDPGYAEAYNNLGFVHRRLGQDEEAAGYYGKFLELEPEIEDARKIRAWLEQSGAQAPPSAQGAGVAAQGLTHRLERAVDGRAAAAPGVRGPRSSVIPRAPVQPPGAPPAPPSAGPAPVARPAGPGAESAAELCEQGISRFEAGDLSGAEELLRRAVNLDPSFAPARSTLGRVFAKAGRSEDAVAELRHAVTLDPADGAAHYVLGYALRNLDRVEEAAGAYEKFLELTPDAEDASQIRTWIAEVRSAGQAPPEGLYGSAAAAYEAGSLDEALEFCEQAVALDAGDFDANLLLGRVLVEKGDLLRAVPALRRAEGLKPDSPDVHYYLAQAYERRGLSSEARAAYRKCLSVAPAGQLADLARAGLEQIQQAGRAAVGPRCELCFRPFPEDQLTAHEGKRICSDCLANVGAARAEQAVAWEAGGVERAVALEAERKKKRRARGKLRKIVLIVTICLLVVLGAGLIALTSGRLKGPFERLGVYSLLERLRLKNVLARIGVEFPEEGPGPEEGPPTDVPVAPSEGPGAPKKERLVLKLDENLDENVPIIALPLRPISFRVRVEGGEGDPELRLAEAPAGMRLDKDTGTISWRPSPSEKPRLQVVTIEARGGEATLRVKLAVGLLFRPADPVQTGVEPGVQMRLAVGKLNVSPDRDRNDIVLAWGRYREGFFNVLYQQPDQPGRFTGGRPTSTDGFPSAVALGDFNGDGRTDVAVADWQNSKIRLFVRDRAGGIVHGGTLEAAKGVGFLAAGDVDGDGMCDLVASHWVEPKLHVYFQREAAGGRILSGPARFETNKPSGWNKVFIGPLAGGPRAVYLMCGSGQEPDFKIFPVREDGLGYFKKCEPPRLFSSRPIDAALYRESPDEPPILAALLGGEDASVKFLAPDGENLKVLEETSIVLERDPVSFAVADMNADGTDDVAVLYPGAVRVYLTEDLAAGKFAPLPKLDVPGAAGPVLASDLTADGRTDMLVGLEDGGLAVLRSASPTEEEK